MKLSVVTPSLNQAAYLAATLHSVREAAARARGSEVEHLVIDGGSTDDTLRILRDQSFATWVSEPDRGQSHAINKGLAAATGDVLCWLCADDLWEPDTAARVLELFAAQPETDVVYGDYHFLEDDSGWKRRKTAGPFSVDRLLRRNFLSQPAVFWRRGVTKTFGPIDESLHYCMDHEFWLRICRGTRWEYLPVPLATARLHGDAKTFRALAPMWEEAARMGPRHGASRLLRLDALRMRLYGQFVYRAKRRWFRWLGHRRTATTS